MPFMPSPVNTALILCGGLGTRLRQVVPDVPKPMASVAGRPFLEHILLYWHKQGIHRFILSTGYKGDVIRRHFGSSWGGTTIEYVYEDSPLGTGGALAYALRSGVFAADAEALLLNGDTWFCASLAILQRDAAALGGSAMLMALLSVEDASRYGSVTLDAQGRVKGFEEKRQGSGLINAGCYLFRPSETLQEFRNMPDAFSLEKDALPYMAEQGKLAASIQQADFIDIGIPEDYARSQYMLAAASGGDHAPALELAR